MPTCLSFALAADSFPSTTLGKVKNNVLEEPIPIKAQEEEAKNADREVDDNRPTLCRLWAQQCDLPVSELDLDASVCTSCDSITLIRLCAKVDPMTGLDMTPSFVDEHQSIRQQADHLCFVAPKRTTPRRKSKPAILTSPGNLNQDQAVSFAQLSEQEWHDFQQETTKSLAPRQWNDVEAVMPLSELGTMTLTNPRHPRSHTQRHVLAVGGMASFTACVEARTSVLDRHAI